MSRSRELRRHLTKSILYRLQLGTGTSSLCFLVRLADLELLNLPVILLTANTALLPRPIAAHLAAPATAAASTFMTLGTIEATMPDNKIPAFSYLPYLKRRLGDWITKHDPQVFHSTSAFWSWSCQALLTVFAAQRRVQNSTTSSGHRMLEICHSNWTPPKHSATLCW